MDIISEIEKYYNSSIAITNVRIWRNYGFNENETKNKKEFFSNFFHIDAYIGTFFKLYIYLQDVEESHGPVEVHSKKISKIYVKASNYKSRNEYEKINFNETLKLIGKKGQSFIFNPTQFLHRASVPNPGNKRDVICIIFNVVPTIPNKKNYFIFENIYNNIIWKDQSLSKKYGKIYDINNLISFYDSLHKSRIVK